MQQFLYLLAAQADFEQALTDGYFSRDSLVDEGFIHASPLHQLTRVANKYYRNVVNPMAIQVETELVEPEVKWESAAGDVYPHIYGKMNMSAVVSAQAIALNDDGQFALGDLTFE